MKLTDFLYENVTRVKLMSHIVPVERYVDSDFNNLDLNLTARKEIKKHENVTEYHTLKSFLVCAFDLAHPIGTTFTPPKSPEPSQSKKTSVKPTPKATPRGGPPKQLSIEEKRELKRIADEKRLKELRAQKKEAIYERAIYIIPYTSKKLVDLIQDGFAKCNYDAMNLEFKTERQLNSYKLSEVERADRELDFVSGYEIIDYDKRMYVFEGLSKGSMAKIEKLVPLSAPNSEKCTILKNKSVLFQERIYMDFNIGIKKFKLRDLLNETLLDPNIYLRKKLPENLYKTIIGI